MSGHPNPNQVAQLVQAAEMVNQLDAEADRLSKVISESKASLEAVQRSRASNAEKIHKLVTSMDCAANGNCGWEGRVVNLMAMVVEEAHKVPS